LSAASTVASNQWFLTFLVPWTILLKKSLGPLSCEQVVESVLHKVTIVRNVLSRIYETYSGPLKIPGGPPVVHLDRVENHCLKWTR